MRNNETHRIFNKQYSLVLNYEINYYALIVYLLSASACIIIFFCKIIGDVADII